MTLGKCSSGRELLFGADPAVAGLLTPETKQYPNLMSMLAKFAVENMADPSATFSTIAVTKDVSTVLKSDKGACGVTHVTCLGQFDCGPIFIHQIGTSEGIASVIDIIRQSAFLLLILHPGIDYCMLCFLYIVRPTSIAFLGIMFFAVGLCCIAAYGLLGFRV